VSEQSRNASDGAEDTRSPAQIERDIEEARERLAGTVDEIAERVKPANVAKKGKESAKAQVVDPRTGAVRTDRVAIIAGVVAFYVALKVWRVSRDRRKGRRAARKRR
jgi:hypothetical protein